MCPILSAVVLPGRHPSLVAAEKIRLDAKTSSSSSRGGGGHGRHMAFSEAEFRSRAAK
jgi:hypothetical protein